MSYFINQHLSNILNVITNFSQTRNMVHGYHEHEALWKRKIV
jgi:hypothetical protein